MLLQRKTTNAGLREGVSSDKLTGYPLAVTWSSRHLQALCAMCRCRILTGSRSSSNGGERGVHLRGHWKFRVWAWLTR